MPSSRLFTLITITISIAGVLVLWNGPKTQGYLNQFSQDYSNFGTKNSTTSTSNGASYANTTGIMANGASTSSSPSLSPSQQSSSSPSFPSLQSSPKPAPPSFSSSQSDVIDKNQLSTCLEDLSTNMPINAQGKMKAHHWDARTPKWNEDERWNPLGLVAPCTIWYIGANTHSRDGVRLQSDYSCSIDVFEPVPEYASQLQENWAGVPHSTVHPYGLGSSTRTVEGVALEGESTFTMEGSSEKGGKGGTELSIRSVYEVWVDLGSPRIDLIHVNCEGCEWEMWEALLEHDLLRQIGTVQVGTHWFPQVIDIEERYCTIEGRMKETHTIAFKQAFGWERWISTP